jgi:hypothetical protein
MSRVALASAICLIGCDAGRPPAEREPTTTAAAEQRVVAAPAAPAPIDAGIVPDAPAPDAFDQLFELPDAMVSRDGRFVLVKVTDDDGARGAQNLELDVRDRRDRTVERVVVLAIDEQLDAAARATRAAAAHKLVTAHDFVPMTPLTGMPADDHLDGAGLVVTWAHERIVIERASQRVVDRAVPAPWRGRRFYSKLDDLVCDNPDYLAAALAAPQHNLVVVDVAYHGNDTCWEPTSQVHVVAW